MDEFWIPSWELLKSMIYTWRKSVCSPLGAYVRFGGRRQRPTEGDVVTMGAFIPRATRYPPCTIDKPLLTFVLRRSS